MLSADNLVKARSDRLIVDGVGLRVDSGEIVALIGPNGAGKSTIFSMLIGAETPDEGTVSLDGQDITALPMYRRARLGMSYGPQDPTFLRGLTVEQNILVALETRDLGRADRRRLLDVLLRAFELEEIRAISADKLSTGQRRRTEIARVFTRTPKYMLLDEPFAGVDPMALASMRQLISRIALSGVGVLISDHNAGELLSLVGRAYIIERGKIIMHGTPDEVVSEPYVRSVYLGEDFRM